MANIEFSGAGFPIISELKKFPNLIKNPAKATVIATRSSIQKGFFLTTFNAKIIVEVTNTIAAPWLAKPENPVNSYVGLVRIGKKTDQISVRKSSGS